MLPKAMRMEKAEAFKREVKKEHMKGSRCSISMENVNIIAMSNGSARPRLFCNFLQPPSPLELLALLKLLVLLELLEQ